MTQRSYSRRQALQMGASSALFVACAPPLTRAPAPDEVVPEAIPGLETPKAGVALEYDEILAWDPRALALDELTFPLGVQAGAPRDASVTLWGHSPSDEVLRVRVWRDAPGGVLLDHDEPVLIGSTQSFRVFIDGLRAGTEYFYAFFNDELTLRSAVGRFRTAFAPDELRPLTLGCITCTNHGRVSRFTSLEQLAEHEVDLLVHLGDMSYNDGATTLADYRAKWHDTLDDPGYRAVLPNAAMIMSWDDHEFTNNLNPTTFPEEQMQAARDSFFENLPMERGPSGQLWTSYRWGRTAELIVLDSRTERIPSGEGKRYISSEQMEFLKDRLLNSPCHFKIVLNSVPITEMPPVWLSQGDRWQGYDSQRAELTNFLEEHELDNTWFLSGDFHTGFVARVEREGFLSRLWEVAVGPSGNFGNPLAMSADAGIAVQATFPSSQFLYGSGRMAATLMTFDPVNDEVRIQFLDDDGTPFFDQIVSRG